jgi:integrase/recombinase XerD
MVRRIAKVMTSPQPKSHKLVDWPTQDRNLWTQITGSGDIFDEQGAGGHWSAEYKKQMGYAYGRWLTFIQKHYLHLLESSPPERLAPETLKGYITYLCEEVSSESVFIYVSRLYELAKVMSKQIHPKTNPSERWAWFKKLVKDLKTRATPKNKRLRMVDADQIYQLGKKLMDEAEAYLESDDASRPSKYQALQYRDGLIIALLAARPMRRKNITGIVIGEHLTREGDLYHLNFEADDVKNRHPLEFAIPQELTPYMGTYLKTYRPAFAGSDTHSGLSENWIKVIRR